MSSPTPKRLTPAEFAARIRQKYAGAYADVPDEDLVRRWLKKYPGAYDDMIDWAGSGGPTTAPAAASPTKPLITEIEEHTRSLPSAAATPSSPAASTGADDSPTSFGDVVDAAAHAKGLPSPRWLLGAVKGAGHTLLNLGDIARHIEPSLQLDELFKPKPKPTLSSLIAPPPAPPPDRIDSLVDDLRGRTEPVGTAEGIGFGGEQLAEFFLPGGAPARVATKAEAAAKLAGAGPKLAGAARIGARALAEGAAATGISAVQTEDPAAALATGGMTAALSGVFGGMGAAVRAGRDSKLVDLVRRIKDATGVEVELTRAQQTQGTIRTAVENRVRGSIFGGRVMDDFAQKQNTQLQKAGEELVNSIAGASGQQPASAVGEWIQHGLEEARITAGDEFGKVVNAIYAEVPGQVVKWEGTLADEAARLLKELKSPTAKVQGLAEVDDVRQAIRILESFAEKTEKRTVPASKILGPGGTPATPASVVETPKTMTVEEAHLLRKLLFKLTDSDAVTIGHGALKRISQALDDAMKTGIASTGRDDLVQTFNAASARYRQVQDVFATSVIRALRRQDKPELILDTLMARGAETSNKVLREALHGADMHRVEQALFARILDEATTREGVLLRDVLDRYRNRIGDEGMKAIFSDPKKLAEIETFFELADNLPAKRGLGNPPSFRAGGNIGVGTLQTLGAGGAFYGATKAAIDRDANGFWLNVASGSAVLVGPWALAKILTRPGAVQSLRRALTTEATSPEGRQLVARIGAWATATASKPDEQAPASQGTPAGDFLGRQAQKPKAAPPAMQKPKTPKPGTSASVTSAPVPVPAPSFLSGMPASSGGHEWPLDKDRERIYLNTADADLRKRADLLIPPGFAGPHSVQYEQADAEWQTAMEKLGIGALYGMDLQTRRYDRNNRKNTVLFSPAVAKDPRVVVHELGHSADYTGGISKEHFDAFADRFVAQANAFREDLSKPGAPSLEEVKEQVFGAKPYRLKYPLAIVRYYLMHAADPQKLSLEDAIHEALAESFGQYFTNPKMFKKTYPEDYTLMQTIVGSGNRPH